MSFRLRAVSTNGIRAQSSEVRIILQSFFSLQTILLSLIENSSYLSKLSGSFILFHLRNKSFTSRKLRIILMHLLFPASSCGYVLHFLKLIASPIQFTQPVLSVYAYHRLNTQRVPTDGKHCSIRVLSLISSS